MALVELQGIYKSYKLGSVSVPVLRGVNLTVAQNESVALIGESGSGKSTLLNLIGFLDQPDRGKILIEGKSIERSDDAQLSLYRGRTIGFVFQGFHLLPSSNALENVMLPLRYRGAPRANAREAAKSALAEVGMSHRAHHKPSDLSGGERQRIAIARAIVGRPKIILADEPTGNLDSRNTKEILEVFARIHESGRTIIVVTHEQSVAEFCQRRLRVTDGKVVSAGSWE